MEWWDSTPEALDVFKTLKYKLIKSPVLVLPQPYNPCMIDNDASAYEQEAGLPQQKNYTNLK